MSAVASHEVVARRSGQPAPAPLLAKSQSEPIEVRHLILDICASHPAEANGVYTVARQLALEQIRAGDAASVTFLCNAGEGLKVGSSEVPTTVRPVAAPKLRGRPLYLPASIASSLMAGAGPHTFFHIHGGRTPLLMQVARALRRRKFAYAVTVHGRYTHVFGDEQEVVRRVPAFYLRWLEAHSLNRARFVHAVSPLERDILRNVAPNARVEFVANAAYSSSLDGLPQAPTRTTVSPNYPVFGFGGRLEIEHKGLDLLVDGFAEYRRTGGRGRLAIFGTGPAQARLDEMVAAHRLNDAVDMLGPRFGEAKYQALHSWDFFVMPSRYDGMPLAALEAGLTGLPLILSSATGLGDYIEHYDAGDMIDPLNAEAVAAAMRRAEALPIGVWRERSANAYEMAVAAGDWTAVARQLRALYERN
jgi:glycosyltransferase involved in cell wall biosynthesis